MPQSTDIPLQDRQTLEEELEQLRTAEASLERKTKDMWSAEVVALVVAFIALVLGAAALAAGLSKATGGTTTVMMRSRGTATPTPAMPAASTGMTSQASRNIALGPRTISVKLGEMYVKPNKRTITAGKVTFVAKNVGMLKHELMIERVPLKMDGPGRPNEDSAQGMIQDMDAGQSGTMTVRVTPGTYELFCNVPGHYAAGQHVQFMVTKKV